MFKDNIASQVEALNIKSQIPAMAKQLAAELKNNEPLFSGTHATGIGAASAI